MKQVAWYIVVVATTLVVLVLLWQFSLSIILFALSLAVAAAVRPLIETLAIRIRSKRIALLLVYSLVIGTMLAVIAGGGQLLLQDLQKATDDFATSYEQIKKDWPNDPSIFKQALGEQLPAPNDLYQAITSEQGILMLTEQGGPGQGLFSVLGYIALIMVMSIYWSADQLRFERLTVFLFPNDMRPKVLHIMRTIEKGVGAYLRSETLQSLLAGLALGVGYWLLGLRYPFLLGTWVAIVRLIPWFGIVVAILPLLLGFGIAPVSSLVAVLFTLVVLLFLRAAIETRVLGQRRNRSLLIVLFVILLVEAFGFIGLLLAPPLAVAVQILLQELYPLFSRRYSQELSEAFELKRRLSGLQRGVRRPASPEPGRYLNQLYQLVRQTITYMQKY